MYNEVNVTSNFTEAVFKGVPHTIYEIEVNGFNEIGHGPTSKVLVVKTLSFGKLEVTSPYLLDCHIVFNQPRPQSLLGVQNGVAKKTLGQGLLRSHPPSGDGPQDEVVFLIVKGINNII